MIDEITGEEAADETDTSLWDESEFTDTGESGDGIIDWSNPANQDSEVIDETGYMDNTNPGYTETTNTASQPTGSASGGQNGQIATVGSKSQTGSQGLGNNLFNGIANPNTTAAKVGQVVKKAVTSGSTVKNPSATKKTTTQTAAQKQTTMYLVIAAVVVFAILMKKRG